MTLQKSIEAAREALKEAVAMADREGNPVEELKFAEALSTLPAKPMTEDKLVKMIVDILAFPEPLKRVAKADAKEIIRALRDAGALYVREKK